MKRFTVVTVLFSVCILVFSLTFNVYSASSPKSKQHNTVIKVRDELGEMRKATPSVCVSVPVTAAYAKIAPVFDATGAIVSDPTGTMLNENYSGCLSVSMMGGDVRIAPVFDTRGQVVSDPSGIILNASH